jgi:hypothetical protein
MSLTSDPAGAGIAAPTGTDAAPPGPPRGLLAALAAGAITAPLATLVPAVLTLPLATARMSIVPAVAPAILLIGASAAHPQNFPGAVRVRGDRGPGRGAADRPDPQGPLTPS